MADSQTKNIDAPVAFLVTVLKVLLEVERVMEDECHRNLMLDPDSIETLVSQLTAALLDAGVAIEVG